MSGEIALTLAQAGSYGIYMVVDID